MPRRGFGFLCGLLWPVLWDTTALVLRAADIILDHLDERRTT